MGGAGSKPAAVAGVARVNNPRLPQNFCDVSLYWRQLHKPSMHKGYIPYAAYHIVLNCAKKIPFFAEDVYCYILADVLIEGQSFKEYRLIGFKINPDHVHIVLVPGPNFDLRAIVHHLKRITSLCINQIRSYSSEDERIRLTWTKDFDLLFKLLALKYGSMTFSPYPFLKWQRSFFDVRMRSRKQLLNTVNYVRCQAIKHGLESNDFLYLKPIPNGIYFQD